MKRKHIIQKKQYIATDIQIKWVKILKERCRDGVMNDFLSWCRNLLVPFIFHDLASLHPPSFQRNDFSTCFTLFFNVLGQSPMKKVYIQPSAQLHSLIHWHFSETKRLVPLYRHFARKSHDFLRDHRIVPLEHCEPDALPVREAYILD